MKNGFNRKDAKHTPRLASFSRKVLDDVKDRRATAHAAPPRPKNRLRLLQGPTKPTQASRSPYCTATALFQLTAKKRIVNLPSLAAAKTPLPRRKNNARPHLRPAH